MSFWTRPLIVIAMVTTAVTGVIASEPASLPGTSNNVQQSVGDGLAPVSPWEMPPGTAIWAMPPQSPHRVIRQPPILSAEEQKQKAQREWMGASPATVDRAAVAPVWRQPYAYGYFGAQPQRHWQRHFGWNKAYTQWTLK